MNAPRKPHWEAICHILRYQKGALGKGLLYRPSSSLLVFRFSDADWANDRNDRQSTSGYCNFVGNNLVTWRSKKQNVVARSSAEVEYRAMAHTACEMLWVQSLLHDMGVGVKEPSCRGPCIVIIRQQFSLLVIQCSTRGLSTLRWTVTLFEI